MAFRLRRIFISDCYVYLLFIVIGILEKCCFYADKLPTFISKEGYHEILSGRTVRLPCEISDLGDYSVVWTKSEKGIDKVIVTERQVVDENPRIAIFVEDFDNTQNWDILINDAEPFDEGDYFCQISTVPNNMIQKQTLVVKVPPKVKIGPEQNPYTVRKGEAFYLTCYPSGNPQPEVVWRKLDGLLPDGHKSYDGETLHFEKALESHEGIYRCTGDNGVAQVSIAEIKIQVIYPPILNETTDPLVIAKLGSSLTIKCSYSANPAPFVEWLFNGYSIEDQLLKRSDRIVVEKMHDDHTGIGISTLSILNITLSDCGDYMCRISNSNGLVRSITHVTAVPSIPEIEFMHNLSKLIWSIESPEPLLAYRLEYKTPGEDFFHHVEFTYNATDNNGSNIYDGEVDLSFLDQELIYNIIVRGRNANGWGKSPSGFIQYKGENYKNFTKRGPKKISLDSFTSRTSSGTSYTNRLISGYNAQWIVPILFFTFIYCSNLC